MTLNFDIFVKDCNSYADFARLMKEQERNVKGDQSEEFALRYLSWAPWLQDVKGIYNTNDPKSKFLVHKFPELQPLGVGTPNSPVVDLIIEHTHGYSLVSCKWYSDGLPMNDIAAFYGLDKDKGYPNLKNKYLFTNAPRTSQVVQQVFKHSHPVIKILEDEFDLDYIGQDFNTIIKNHIADKPLYQIFKDWRNKREQLSFIKFAKRIKKEYKAKVQLPPGWGKTYLMWRLDKYLWKQFGGQTICMADGVIVLKQNFDLYNRQYKHYGIERPSIVICSGADDESMVDWPVEVVGRDPVRVARWLQKNPDGIIFCFYGNTQTLEEAVRLNKIKNKHVDFTFAACDEASRTCGQIGSGWSHIVHDSLVPVKYRAFLDATHRHHKDVGMNVRSLYGEMADHVSQVDSEKWGSTTGFFIQGLTFSSKHIQELFHKREFIKGKHYTVDEKCAAFALLEEFVKDPTMEHNLTFGHTIKNLKNFAQALEDVRSELLKNKSSKYQKLKNIKVYVADTHVKTSRDIRDDLDIIYKKEKRSIVLTSRLLYRGWSQVKLDSILFNDNFNSVSYTVQALGRGLRKNDNRPNKLCKVLVPCDLAISGGWDHMIRLLNNIKDAGDSRPVEDILGQIKSPRGKAKRNPQSGSVVLPITGHNISVAEMRKGLKTAIVNGTNWFEWNIWFDLAREMFKKVESNKHLIPATGGRNYANEIVYKELIRNDRYKTVIDSEYKENKVTKENKHVWLWRKVIKLGFKKIKHTDEWKSFKMDILDAIENNDQEKRRLVKDLFDKKIELQKKYWMMGRGTNGKNINKQHYDKDLEILAKETENTLGVYYPKRKGKWMTWLRDIDGTDLLDQNYVEQKSNERDQEIEQKRHEWANEVYESVFVLHAQEGVPMGIIRRHVEDMCFDEPNKFERWIHTGQYGNPEYHKKFKGYIEYPVLREGQPRCSCCNKQGGEMWTRYKNYGKPAQEKYWGFYEICAPCRKEQKSLLTNSTSDCSIYT